MANILFVSNNVSHFVNGNTKSDSARFDAARVPYSISLYFGAAMATPQFTPTTGDVTWCHFRFYFTGMENQDLFHLIRGYDVNGNLLFDITKFFNSFEYFCVLKLYKASGQSTTNQTFPFNRAEINNVDVRYEQTGTKVKVSMYVNGGLAAELEDLNPVTMGQVAQISLGATFCANDGAPNDTHTVDFSEIIIADGDTRNARMDLLRPTASGGETDWVGDATDLADDDPSSGMTAIANDERQTLQLSAYGGASNISAVVVATQGMAGNNGPQNIRHTVRMSTVNYDGPVDLPLADTLQFSLTDFKINPATSQPWTGADLASLEMGFIAKT